MDRYALAAVAAAAALVVLTAPATAGLGGSGTLGGPGAPDASGGTDAPGLTVSAAASTHDHRAAAGTHDHRAAVGLPDHPRAADAAATARLSGAVTTAAGDPVADAAVVVQPANASFFRDLAVRGSPHEGFLKLASTAPDAVHVARTDADGRYALSLPAGRYDVVAVTEARLSGPTTVTVAGNATHDLTVHDERVLAVAGASSGYDPGEPVTVTVAVRNPTDDPARNVTLRVADVPAGWDLLGASADGGTATGDARTLSWDRVPAGGEGTATLRLRPPADADRGYGVALAGTSDTHFLATGTARLWLRGATTSTYLSGGETSPAGGPGNDTTPTTAPPARTDTDGGSLPGLSALGAVAALVVALVALGARRR